MFMITCFLSALLQVVLDESADMPACITASRREVGAVCFNVSAKPSATHSEVVAIDDVRNTAIALISVMRQAC
jgi:hypothetical protein